MELFDFINNINYYKKPVLDEDEKADKFYLPFMVNKYYSFFADTIFYANEMNCNWELDKKLQHDFYLNGIRKKKRFNAWVKKDTEDDIETIKKAYNYTESKAQEVLNILGPDGVKKLKLFMLKGGTNSKE